MMLRCAVAEAAGSDVGAAEREVRILRDASSSPATMR